LQATSPEISRPHTLESRPNWREPNWLHP